MTRQLKILLGMLLFNGLTSAAGGLALMAISDDKMGWTKHTDFPSLFLPGLVLFGIVGGSALLASVLLLKDIAGWKFWAILSGIIMLLWIVGEIVSIRTFHILHLVYLTTGLWVIKLTPNGK